MRRGLNIAAVSIVRHVGHRHEGVIQCLAWGDPPLLSIQYEFVIGLVNTQNYLVHSQHPLEQVNELPPVNLFRQQLPALQVSRYIHLPHILQAVEDVLPRLFRLDLSLALVLLWRLQSPKRVAGVAITVEEFDGFTCIVQHVFCRQALGLADVSDLIVL